VARNYLEKKRLSPYLLVHPDLETEFSGLISAEPNAVLVGDAAHAFTYENMNAAFRLLLEGAPLLAMGVNRYFLEVDKFILDAGPFVAALEYATGTQATVLGKPSREFYREAVASLGCDPGETVMVGDDVEADVIGAIEAGLEALLVRTGKYRAGDEQKLAGKAACVADIGEAVERILAMP